MLEPLAEAGGWEVLLARSHESLTALHVSAREGLLESSQCLAHIGGKRLLAAKDSQSLTAEEHARAKGHGALALMLRRSRIGMIGADVCGQARPVSEQEAALAVERADAAMAALLAEESGASKDGAAGAAGDSRAGKAGGIDKDKGRAGKKKKN